MREECAADFCDFEKRKGSADFSTEPVGLNGPNLVQLGNFGALGNCCHLGEKTKRLRVVFFVSSTTEVLEYHHTVVTIVRFTDCRLNGNVRCYATKENGIHLERVQNRFKRCRVECTDAVLGNEKIRVGLVEGLMDFRCPRAKLERAELLNGPKERGRLGPFAIVG